MAVPTIPAADYFNDEDYLPPRSPGLPPVKFDWYTREIDVVKGKKRALSYDSDDSDEELDLDSSWSPRERESPGLLALRQSRGPVSTPRRIAATTRALLHLMGNGSTWYFGDSELQDDPATQRTASSFNDIIPSEPPTYSNQTIPTVFRSAAVQPTNTSSKPQRKIRKRLGLPIIIDGKNESITVMACPDTGSDESIVPLALAERLGLQIARDTMNDEDRTFVLANGKVVRSLGVASLRCSFGAPGVMNAGSTKSLELLVHIFESLAVPAIIGAAFLEETETFTKHRNRLVEELIPGMQSLRVCAVGKPKRGLVCRLDTFVGCANADTGSDLDLVSPEFIQQRGFRVKEGVEILQFADGSTALTRGTIDVSFAIGDVQGERGFIPRGSALDLEFFILDNLTSDILVGQDTLEELSVLSQNGDLFIDSLPRPGSSDCNIIRHIGTIERAARSALEAVKGIFTGRDRHSSPSAPSVGENNPEGQLTAIQRENARLEAEADGKLYECKVPGCSAPPFATQFLLNSHSDSHSSARPYFCPVKSCSRSEGGKGFKRKGQMLRHGLVHDSPGYYCPFCPDQENKYPRPDNLQRHVRVWHTDKDPNDPVLRDVLNQRPDGPNRSRRRKAVS